MSVGCFRIKDRGKGLNASLQFLKARAGVDFVTESEELVAVFDYLGIIFQFSVRGNVELEDVRSQRGVWKF
jgi:hypothetical protein